MKREEADFFTIRPEHAEIHERCLNWSKTVRVNHSRTPTAPMFRQYRSTETLHSPSSPEFVDRLDGHQMEKAVIALPAKHRIAVQWLYVYASGAHGGKAVPWYRVTKFLATPKSGLITLIHDARSMLKNRSRE